METVSPPFSLRRLAYVAVSLTVIVLDQITKSMVDNQIPLHSSITVISGLLDLTHVKNTGAAFGLFASIESPFRALFLNAVAFAVFIAVAIYAWRTSVTSTRLQSGLALILGGAVGNLIDRVRYGSVTDFLDVYLGSYRWPAFNVADSAITIGVLLLAWDIFRSKEPATERPAAA